MLRALKDIKQPIWFIPCRPFSFSDHFSYIILDSVILAKNAVKIRQYPWIPTLDIQWWLWYNFIRRNSYSRECDVPDVNGVDLSIVKGIIW